jgi:hypothetical protein
MPAASTDEVFRWWLSPLATALHTEVLSLGRHGMLIPAMHSEAANQMDKIFASA